MCVKGNTTITGTNTTTCNTATCNTATRNTNTAFTNTASTNTPNNNSASKQCLCTNGSTWWGTIESVGHNACHVCEKPTWGQKNSI